jgi:hypothetical protein
MPDLVSDDERLKRIQALTQIAPPNAAPSQPVPTAPNIPTAIQPALRPIGSLSQPEKPPPMAGSSEDYGNQIQAIKNKQADPWGSPDNHPGILGKVGHTLSAIGQGVGAAINPSIVAGIPGTQLNMQGKENALEEKQMGAKKAESEQSLQAAQTEEAKGRTALTDAQATALPGKEQSEESLQGAQANEANARAFLAQHPEAKTPQEGYAAAIQDVLKKGGDPLTDPTVKQWQNAIQAATTAEQDTSRAETIRQSQLLGKPVTPEDAAWLKSHNTEKTLVPAANVNLNAPKVADARSDRSYQATSAQLDRVQTPIDQTVQRLGRLQDTLNQNTPQADALVAPELLSVMAGGVGSGVRMNEAEIARIVGGRSKWETLKASINQWSLDPKSARSITPEQQQEIHALTQTVHDKLTAKQKILDDARQELIDSDDPKDHRRILADTHQKLTAVDNGEAESDNGSKVPSFADWQKGQGH